MSHELRTPLNAIIGFSDLLKQADKISIPLEQSLEYAGHISRAGHNLLGVVSDVLDISRIESGAFKLEKSSADIGNAVLDAVDVIATKIKGKKQTIEIKVAPGLPLIEFDYKRMRKVLGNLSVQRQQVYSGRRPHGRWWRPLKAAATSPSPSRTTA